MRTLPVLPALLFTALPALAQSTAPTRLNPAGGSIDPPLSPRNASYSINATLDASGRALTGSEVITWRNVTTKPASDLRFHLYWNAWRDDRSTWLREARLRALGEPTRRESDWARIDVTSMRLVSGPGTSGRDPIDLTSRMAFVAPDDGNADDRTVTTVTLPTPVPPGATLAVAVEWTAHVPRTFARTGAVGNYFAHRSAYPHVGWEAFGERFGRPPRFTGEPGPALLGDPAECVRLLGPPEVSLVRLIDWVAAWVERGGRSLGKPTHFESTDGRF